MSRNSYSNKSIEEYLPICKKLARRFTGLWSAEFDDLVQEGWIACWMALESGYRPTKTYIENRMRNWVGVCRRRGFTDEYEE